MSCELKVKNCDCRGGGFKCKGTVPPKRLLDVSVCEDKMGCPVYQRYLEHGKVIKSAFGDKTTNLLIETL